ncbi:MAG: PAS domain S-box protein [Terracidiphilus sp.]
MKKYVLAALSVVLAACISIALRPLLVEFPALVPLLFFGAVAFIARYVGFAPSIFALAMSAALMDVFFFQAWPHYSLLGLALVKTLFFCVLGVSLSLLMRRLHEAEAYRTRLAAIVDSSHDAIISKDLNGVVTSWNGAAVQMFGYKPEEMIGRPILEMVPEEYYEEEAGTLRNLQEGRHLEPIETERLTKHGALIKVSLTISPLMDAEGQVIGASTIARDITERAKMQEAFIESEKLAATGRMAAAIAHEINNPLEAVTNLAFLIHHNQSLDASAKEYSQMLMEEIHRISNVAKRSLTFFRDTGKPAEFDLAGTLDAVLDLNNPLFVQKGLSIRREYKGPCEGFGSSAEMRQVFSNLIRNAIDAVEFGGEIRVRVRASDDGNWRISVADNGRGIPPEARERLFQPFVTTKGNTGNGLGLWISRGIVEKHGGQIRARSAVIGGRPWTVFSVELPCANVVAKERMAAAAV